MLTVNASVHTAQELRATADYLRVLADLQEVRTAEYVREVTNGAALAGLGGAVQTLAAMQQQRTIAPEDNPSTGAPEAPLPSAIDAHHAAAIARDQAAAAAVFGGAVAQIPPPPPLNDAALSVSPPAATPLSAGTAPTAAAAASAPGVEVDVTGLPWDQRIHGSTKTKNADGTWRQRRGLNDAALKARVEAELRAAAAAPAAVPMPPAAPVSAVPPPPVGAPAVPPVPSSATPSAPAGTATPASPSSGPALGPVSTLPELMQQVAPLMARGALSMPAVIEACQAVGVPSLAVLGTRPDLVPSVWQQLHNRLLPAGA